MNEARISPPLLVLVDLDRRRRIVAGANALADLLDLPRCDLAERCFDSLVHRRDRRGHNLYNDLVLQLAPGEQRGALVALRTAEDRPCLCLLDVRRVADGWRAAVRKVAPGDAVHDLVVSDERWRGILRGAAEGIAVIDEERRLVEFNEQFLTLLNMTGPDGVLLAAEAVRGRPLRELVEPGTLQPVEAALLKLKRTADLRIRLGSRSASVTLTPLMIAGGAKVGTCLVVRDLTAREQMHRLRGDAARSAGMAEVATGVLHNVGNALCSIRTSASLLDRALDASPLKKLDRVLDLFAEQSDLAAFVASPRGEKAFAYIDRVRDQLHRQQDSLRSETRALDESIEHIGNVVAAQNRHARSGTMLESCGVAELLEASVQLASPMFEDMGVDLVAEVESDRVLVTARHSVVQVLTNLLLNAAQAVRDAGRSAGYVQLEHVCTESELVIRVIDNGVGFDPDAKELLFQFGYTTKPDGNGFGLHDSFNSCRALGGKLRAESAGPDRGATFELRLPLTNAGSSAA